jgi:hypothetical protein
LKIAHPSNTISRNLRRFCEFLREGDSKPGELSDLTAVAGELSAEEASTKWKDFEERVRYIYDVLLNIDGEKVAVSRDVKLKGRDGLVHQFDVYYEFSRAGLDHRIAIECKDRSRPTEKDDVMAFRAKVSDVPGLEGVIVSARGYQSGAKKFATDNGLVALTMGELPKSGDLLATRLERAVFPPEESIGEPFWSLYEGEDGKLNGVIYHHVINGWYGALLFYCKKLAEKFLANQTQDVRLQWAVRGLSQPFLRSFILIADTCRANYWMVTDVKSPDLLGLVPITRDDLIANYVLEPDTLPKEPLVAPALRDKFSLR